VCKKWYKISRDIINTKFPLEVRQYLIKREVAAREYTRKMKSSPQLIASDPLADERRRKARQDNTSHYVPIDVDIQTQERQIREQERIRNVPGNSLTCFHLSLASTLQTTYYFIYS
jgi:hypothetical protein